MNHNERTKGLTRTLLALMQPDPCIFPQIHCALLFLERRSGSSGLLSGGGISASFESKSIAPGREARACTASSTGMMASRSSDTSVLAAGRLDDVSRRSVASIMRFE